MAHDKGRLIQSAASFLPNPFEPKPLCTIVHEFFFPAKVNIVEAPDIIRAPFGTSYELQCVATGDPPPLISWLKDGRTVNKAQKSIKLLTFS